MKERKIKGYSRPDAITRILLSNGSRLRYGKEACIRNVRRLSTLCNLNCYIDPPLPNWAMKVIIDAEISASQKVAILYHHQKDIGMSPEFNRQALNAKGIKREGKPYPPEINKFRTKQINIAKQYIEELDNKEEEKENE